MQAHSARLFSLLITQCLPKPQYLFSQDPKGPSWIRNSGDKRGKNKANSWLCYWNYECIPKEQMKNMFKYYHRNYTIKELATKPSGSLLRKHLKCFKGFLCIFSSSSVLTSKSSKIWKLLIVLLNYNFQNFDKVCNAYWPTSPSPPYLLIPPCPLTNFFLIFMSANLVLWAIVIILVRLCDYGFGVIL